MDTMTGRMSLLSDGAARNALFCALGIPAPIGNGANPDTPGQSDAPHQHLIIVRADGGASLSLERWLANAGFVVDVTTRPEDVPKLCERRDSDSVVLLECGEDSQTGIRILRDLQRSGVNLPIICVVHHRHAWLEDLVLELGAADIIERSVRSTILARRILRAAATYRLTVERSGMVRSVNVGPLRMNIGASRCHWRDEPVPLTTTEFRIVRVLIAHAGKDLSYRTIYDAVRGEGFVAGSGNEGYRTNVRSLIRRIRHKFRSVDPSFAEIENYAGFGYRWRPVAGPSDGVADEA